MAKKRSRKPDLEDLGDPWAEPGGSDAPDAGDLQAAHEQLRVAVEAHPGIPGSKQPRPWHVPDDEISNELLGPPPEHGLSQDEKLAAFEQGKRDLDSASRKDVRKAKKSARKQEQRAAKADADAQRTADEMWRRFQARHADAAKDPEAVAAAADHVLERVELEGLSPQQYLDEHPDSFLMEVADEVREPKRHRQRQDADQQADRQQLMPSQSSARPAPKADDGPGDFMAELQEVQRKSGFH